MSTKVRIQNKRTHQSLKNEVLDVPILDTIAQLVHTPKIGGLEVLKKRAKNQYFSKKLSQKLTQIEGSPLNKAYRRTFFDCGQVIIQEGRKLKSGYCNARWCNTCNRIRTAKLVKGYKKAIESMNDPFFVTLTVPNVKPEELGYSIKKMIKNIVLIIKNRRRETEINGIRKLECTYNYSRNDYHPHLHFIVDGRENAEYLKKEWLLRNPEAEHFCQDTRRALPGSEMELFKYTTKIVSKSQNGFEIYIEPLDIIFQAMNTLRTFQSFGKVRKVNEDIQGTEVEEYDIPFYESVAWVWENNDWVNMLDGKKLSGYEPSKKMESLTSEKMILYPLKT